MLLSQVEAALLVPLAWTLDLVTSASFALRCWARSGSTGALGSSATSSKRGHGLDCELPLVPIVAGV